MGRDGRLSGPSLSEALIKGLVATGVEVIDVGAVTTPMLYFAAHTLCRSGIQVTGSHNPKDYNGFKMVLKGAAVYGEQIQGLKRRIEAEDYAKGKGRLGKMDVVAEYTQRIVSDCKLARPMKIVVDSGNGIPGATAPAILRALGCEVIDIFSKVDGAAMSKPFRRGLFSRVGLNVGPGIAAEAVTPEGLHRVVGQLLDAKVV